MSAFFFSATGPPPVWRTTNALAPTSRATPVLKANDLREKAPEEEVVKWSELFTDKKLTRSVVVTSSQAGLFVNAINAAATVPENVTLDDVKLHLAPVCLLTEGPA